jgi:hypothetical protein
VRGDERFEFHALSPRRGDRADVPGEIGAFF